MAASQRRCPGLLVWGKLIRLCQHPNKASKIFTNSSCFCIKKLAFNSLKLLPGSSKNVQAVGPDTSVTVSSGFCPDFVSLNFQIALTQIVIGFSAEHHFNTLNAGILDLLH